MNHAPSTSLLTYQKARLSQATRSPAEHWGRCFICYILGVWATSYLIGFTSALGLISLAGFVAAILGVQYKVLGLLGIGMLCCLDAPMRTLLMSNGLLPWNTLNYWLLLILVLFMPYLFRLRDAHSWLLLSLIALLTAQIAISPELESGMQEALNFISSFGLLIYCLRASRDNEAWYWLGLVNGTLAAAGGLAFFMDPSISLSLQRQPGITFMNANAWSFFPNMALFSICLGFRVVAGQRRAELILGLLAVINFVWVFLSGSRGGLLLAILCILFLILSMPGLSRRLLLISVLLVIGLGIVANFQDRQAYTLHRINNLLNDDASLVERTSGRSDLAIAGWNIFLDHPFGIGTGGFAPEWADISAYQKAGLSGWKRGHEMNAHAGWIKVLAENGFLGALLLGGYVLSFAIAGWRRRQQGVLLLGLMTTLCLGVAFISTEFQSKALWFLAAATTALLYRGGNCSINACEGPHGESRSKPGQA